MAHRCPSKTNFESQLSLTKKKHAKIKEHTIDNATDRPIDQEIFKKERIGAHGGNIDYTCVDGSFCT